VGTVHELSARRDWFVDDRGDGRRLQATWHPEHQLVVLSIWHGERCTASFRLPVADADRMIAFLAASLGDTARSSSTAADSATS
jgi:hypothetical protein